MPLLRTPFVGAHHPAVRRLLRARRGLDSSTPYVLVEGGWAHDFAHVQGARPEVLVWCEESVHDDESRERLATLVDQAAEAYQVSARTMARIRTRHGGSGPVSLVPLPCWSAADIVGRRAAPVVLVADGVQYAVNLGTLLRIVDAFGADGLVLTNRRARLTHPTVFTASRGALLTTPVLEFPDATEALVWLDRLGFVRYLADPAADHDYQAIRPAARPTAVVVGSEGRGISPQWYAPPHVAVSIPMRGAVDSLNVAVAAAVLLFRLAE